MHANVRHRHPQHLVHTNAISEEAAASTQAYEQQFTRPSQRTMIAAYETPLQQVLHTMARESSRIPVGGLCERRLFGQLKKGTLLQLARRGGIKRIQREAINYGRLVALNFTGRMMERAMTYARAANRNTILQRDVTAAFQSLQQHDMPVYFG